MTILVWRYLSFYGKLEFKMRDLAQRSYNRENLDFKKKARVIVFLIIIIGLFFLLKDKFYSPLTSVGSSQGLKDAPKGLTPVQIGENLVSAKEGVNLKTDTASFTNVSEGAAAATAVRKYGDGSYSLVVNAALPDPKGNRYQVWIVGGGKSFDAGFLNGKDSSWTQVFRDKDYYSKHDEIWITREITTEDGKPEKHILEGSFL